MVSIGEDAAFYLSKLTARDQAWVRVRDLADGRFWVEPARNCLRYTNVRVSCQYWEEEYLSFGGAFVCRGDMMVTRYTDGWVRQGVNLRCG